jgi:hypothetical protein
MSGSDAPASDVTVEPSVGPQAIPTWAVGVPTALLLGLLALLGRAGVGIQIAGLPVGALLTPVPTLIVAGLVATRRGRTLLRSFNGPQRRVVILVAIAVGAGLLRAAAQGVPTLLRFQDMAYLLHLPWIIVGMAAMQSLRSDAERIRVLTWLSWTLLCVLGLHWGRGIIPGVDTLLSSLVAALEGLSDKPDRLITDSDRALYGLVLAGASVHLAVESRTRSLVKVAVAGLIVGAHLAGFLLGGSRGALLGTIIGVSALTLLGGLSSRPVQVLLSTIALALLVSTMLALQGVDAQPLPDATEAIDASNPAHNDPPPSNVNQPPISESLPDATEAIDASNPAHNDPPPSNENQPRISDRYEAAAGRRSLTDTSEQLRREGGEWSRPGTVSWRVDIWTEVIEEWKESWRNRIFGIGYGNEIAAMTVPGRQGFDELNRGVHSILFTTIARQGLVGLALATSLFLVLLLGSTSPPTLTIPVLLCALTVGMFDVFFENAHSPIMLWLVIGQGIALAQDNASIRGS